MKKLIAIVLTLVLAAALCACGSSSSGNDPGAGLKGYTFYCVDESGKPVEGVKVEFCSDTTCSMVETDANGIANFDVPNGVYTIHIAKVPSGYGLPAEAEFQTSATAGTTTVVIPAA